MYVKYCKVTKHEMGFSLQIFEKRETARNLYFPLNEATRANLEVNKTILNWQPFWNKVYGVSFPSNLPNDFNLLIKLVKKIIHTIN